MRFEKRSAGEFLLQLQLEGEQRVGLFSPLPSSFPGSFSPQPGAVHSPLPLQHLSPPSQPSETRPLPPQTPARTLGPGVAPQQVPLSGAGFWGRPFGISASVLGHLVPPHPSSLPLHPSPSHPSPSSSPSAPLSFTSLPFASLPLRISARSHPSPPHLRFSPLGPSAP